MTKFKDTFVGKEFSHIEEFFDHDLAQAIELARPLLAVLIADAKKYGWDAIKAAAAAAGTAAAADIASGKSPSTAGKDAIRAAETAGGAAILAGAAATVADVKGALSADTTHTIATAKVAEAKGA